ncbi:MAG: ABC transporter substrate-binding protein [Firmicutes bacterium]|nr:ABC transporter substrate-binding protein [Bacillota bacterium]
MQRKWKSFLVLSGILLLTGILSFQLLAANDISPYVVGAFLSVTGPNAPLGAPERDTLLMLAKQINQAGGINGHPLKLVIEDDASDNTKAVIAVKKLIEQDRVCAIIGGSGTGPTMAVIPITEEAKIPQIALAAGIAITDPIKSFVFRVAPTDYIMAGKIFSYFAKHKITRIAVIYDSNAYGTSGRDQIRILAAKNKALIVAEESFASADTDMTVQLTKIRAAKPQAIICWGTNPGPAQVAKGVKQLAIKTPLFMSHGVANQAFLDQAGPAAEGVILPAVKLIIANELKSSDPQKKILLQFAESFQKTYNRPADHYGGHAWDALNIIVQALKKAGNDPVKLRDEIEKTKNFVGIDGIFDYSPANHDLSGDSCAMLMIKKGKWTVLKD